MSTDREPPWTFTLRLRRPRHPSELSDRRSPVRPVEMGLLWQISRWSDNNLLELSMLSMLVLITAGTTYALEHELAAALMFAALLGTLGLGAGFAMPRRLRRLTRHARTDTDIGGPAVLVGQITAIPEPIYTPYYEHPCAAYWSRYQRRFDDTPTEATDSTTFVMSCGGEPIAVEAERAAVLFNPAEPTLFEHSDTLLAEEIVARVGDTVVVAGHLVRNTAGSSPYRDQEAVARITRSWRRLVVGLLTKGATEPTIRLDLQKEQDVVDSSGAKSSIDAL